MTTQLRSEYYAMWLGGRIQRSHNLHRRYVRVIEFMVLYLCSYSLSYV